MKYKVKIYYEEEVEAVNETDAASEVLNNFNPAHNIEILQVERVLVTKPLPEEDIEDFVEEYRQLFPPHLKTEDGKTNLAIQRANMTLTHLLGALTEISKMLTGMAQAALAGSDVSVGTSVPWGYSESHSYCDKACPTV